jgi:hypothetical protein
VQSNPGGDHYASWPAPATRDGAAARSSTVAAPGPWRTLLGWWLRERSNPTRLSKPTPNVAVRTAPRMSASPTCALEVRDGVNLWRRLFVVLMKES